MRDRVTERDTVHVGVSKCGHGWECVAAALWLGVQVCQHVTMHACVCVEPGVTCVPMGRLCGCIRFGLGNCVCDQTWLCYSHGPAVAPWSMALLCPGSNRVQDHRAIPILQPPFEATKQTPSLGWAKTGSGSPAPHLQVLVAAQGRKRGLVFHPPPKGGN